MQAKQKQSKSERKNQAAAVESEKAKVKERLLALDAFRRNQNPSQNEVYNYLESYRAILSMIAPRIIIFKNPSDRTAYFRKTSWND